MMPVLAHIGSHIHVSSTKNVNLSHILSTYEMLRNYVQLWSRNNISSLSSVKRSALEDKLFINGNSFIMFVHHHVIITQLLLQCIIPYCTRYERDVLTSQLSPCESHSRQFYQRGQTCSVSTPTYRLRQNLSPTWDVRRRQTDPN